MFQQNVEWIRRTYAAPDPLAALAERSAADVEFDLTAVYPDQPILRGVDEARRFRDESPWGESQRFEPERLIEVDDERVLAFVRGTAMGRASGVPIEAYPAHEFTIRDGLLVRFKVYLDRADALEATGLSTARASATHRAEMATDNVEAFTRAIEAFNRRDIDAVIAELHRDVEWHPGLAASLGGEATVYRGHEGVRRLIRDLDEVFSETHMEFSEIRDLGDRVLAIGSSRTRGKTSGAETETPFCYLADVEDGKAIRVRTYLDARQALEAAGLTG